MACLFCSIAKDTVPAKIDYQDNDITAFRDIFPKAPVHILIIPNQHISTINDFTDASLPLISQMTNTAKSLAKAFNLSGQGYRLVMNCQAGAGQTVFHVHMHLLGGREFSWPPG